MTTATKPVEQELSKEARAVRWAAELLDKEKPGWENSVDLDTFNVGNGNCCVLFYVYGNYVLGLRKLGVNMNDANMFNFWEYHGSGEWRADYAFADGHSTPLWREEIRIRRAVG